MQILYKKEIPQIFLRRPGTVSCTYGIDTQHITNIVVHPVPYFNRGTGYTTIPITDYLSTRYHPYNIPDHHKKKETSPKGCLCKIYLDIIDYLLSAVATSTAQATLNLPSGCYRCRVLPCELSV